MPAPWARGAQVRIIGEIHGTQTNNVLNLATNQVINDNPAEIAQILTTLALAIFACVVENLLVPVTSDWRFLRVEAKLIHPNVSDPVVQPAQPQHVGQSDPTNVSFACALVHIRTGTGGKSGRGRIFFPPPGDTQMINSGLGALAVEDFGAMLQCIIGKFIGAGATEQWRLGVLSTKLVGDPPALPPYDQRFREATALELDTDVSVLRSRKKGKGI